jgi:hypothetical protein
MNSITDLTPQQLRHAADIQERIASLQKELSAIFGASAQSVRTEPPKRRKMSAAGRKAIAAAARLRWAKIKGATTTAKSAAAPKRKMNAAGRARLSALARARWKTARAQGKATL